MKIKKSILFGSLISTMILSSAFVNPNPSPSMSEEAGIKEFASFLSHFEKTELPFQLRLDDLKQYEQQPAQQLKYSKKKVQKKAGVSTLANTKYLPEINFGRFSRMGSPEVEPIARFYPTEKTIAVIYSVKRRFGSQLNKQYQMMLFDFKGNAIATSKDYGKNVSFPIGSTSMDETITCQIDRNGRIWKNTYENIWEKDVRKSGIRDNQLLGFKIKDTEVYSWNETGMIAKMKEIPTNDRAAK